MAVYPVEIPHLDRFAIFHSTSDTMFSPTFAGDNGELAAHIFAAHYSTRRSWNTDISERAQECLAAAIGAFLSAFELAENSSPLPAAWRQEWEQRFDCRNPEPTDVYDIIEAFERDYPLAAVVMDAFYVWCKTKVQA